MPADALESENPLERAAAAAVIGVSSVADIAVVRRLAGLVAGDPDPRVRVAALGALSRQGGDTESLQKAWASAAGDTYAAVRRRAAEVAVDMPVGAAPGLVMMLDDEEPLVAEAAAFALGELAEDAVTAGAVEALAVVATDHRDPLVREAAVAALGSLGDPAGLPAVLAAMYDRPPVRRRAVLALSAFEGDDVEAALRHALEDRDWQVRQAAEDLLRE